VNGVLLVDKPAGPTSHDIVNRVRRAAGQRRVGHTGTLDPAATGLLILCLGRATRLSEFLTGMDKVYEGAMRLGMSTDSYDLDGQVLEERPVPDLTEEDLQAAFDRLVGDIMQVPPMVSAVKVGGERLYKKARKGEWVERPARPVTVREFRLLGYDPPDARFRVRCTSGTYARTLCHDVGEHLGCGATLASLRRTFVGKHSVEDAVAIDALTKAADVAARLLPLDQALDLPAAVVRDEQRRWVAEGRALLLSDITWQTPPGSTGGWVQIKTRAGELLAVGEYQSNPLGDRVQPRRVFCRRP